MRDNKFIKILISVLFWFILWHCTVLMMSQTIKSAELLLPYPMTVFWRITELLQTQFFWLTTGHSLARVFVAFIISAVLGSLIAVLSSVSGIIRAITAPMMTVMRATPIASFIILMILWLPTAGSVSLWAAVLMAAPIFWANISSAISAVDRSLLDMAKVYDFGRAGTIRHVYIPSIKPAIISACESAVGLSWKAAVAAEVLTRPEFAIGRMVYESKIYFETTDLFAWTAVVILLSVALEKLVQCMVRRVSGE